MSLYVYRLPSREYLAVETGQAQDAVRTGFAKTPGRAVANARSDGGATPIQSVGPDCGREAGIRWTFGECQEPVPPLERVAYEESDS